MKQIFTLILLLSTSAVFAQLVDFENANLDPETTDIGASGDGGFDFGEIYLPNVYTPAYNSWSGWAISNETDVTTQSFMNNSAITGGGASSSSVYAVSYAFNGSIFNHAEDIKIESIEVTNSTFAALDMLNGDNSGYDISKRFGGVDGNDPDFFLLTIRGFVDGQLTDDNVEFYLADYRFEDNSMDYIIDEWTTVDLSSLGETDSLFFTLTSSDEGAYGMNTPAYFCIDNVSYSTVTSAKDISNKNTLTIYPNPTSGTFQIENLEAEALCTIYSMEGKLVYHQNFSNTISSEIDLSIQPSGTYIVKVTDEKGVRTEMLVVE